MRFPNKDEVFQEFGIEPIEEDPSLALCRYKFHSREFNLDLLVTFSAVQESFEVIVFCLGQEIINIVSERTEKVELYRDSTGRGLRASFEISGMQAEAVVILEPKVSCRWWLIKNE